MPLSSLVYSTPTPSSISYMWNYGSLLGICLFIQLLTGVFLSFHYTATLDGAFESVVKICEEVNWGWVIRSLHANGASFFFILIYLHVARGVYFGSYMFILTWEIGVVILLVLMATAFLGYVLPWGQMSLWGATVITNLLSALPYIGVMLVEWIWGGFSVSQPTLERFFSIHFILPFLILSLVVVHIASLHLTGSSNPLGVDLHSDKVFFHPYFVVKDLLGLMMFALVFLFISVSSGDLFMDPDNFIFANPLSTPPHIQPEWYFLFAYAILRSVPNKLGGVLALLFSILVLSFLPLSKGGFNQSAVKKFFVWMQVSIFFILTWIGAMPVEVPFVNIGQLISLMYFIVLMVVSLL